MTHPGYDRCHVMTPRGSGAIGVIRVVGRNAESIVTRLCRARTNAPFTLPRDGQVRTARVVCDGEALDDAVVSRVPLALPAAFDLCLHGGTRILERVSEALCELGAPPMGEVDHEASPAAARVDAFGNGGNLVEREALALMPGARTSSGLEMLAWQRVHLPAALRRVEHLSKSDWPRAKLELQAMRNRHDSARLLLEGCAIAIVGPVNSGKSSLFNRMVGREAALVSPRPGTTLDWVSETVDMGGVAITLHDTAGVNPSPGAGERCAIEAGRRLLNSCRLAWRVVDVSDKDHTQPANRNGLDKDPLPSTVLVLNKMDLVDRREEKFTNNIENNSQHKTVPCSTLTGEGLHALKSVTLESLGFDNDVLCAPSLFTERQRRLADSILSFDSADGSHAQTAFPSLLWKSFDEDEKPGL